MKATATMRAMVMEKAQQPLRLMEVPVPYPQPGQMLIRVLACGVCRTDLHVVDGELPNPKLPLILGHEIVGRIVEMGSHVSGFQIGNRVGVPWLGSTCGRCRYCVGGEENLCDFAQFTGYTLDGGYADYVVADHRYCFRLGEKLGDAELAPLLCAGLIGYRSYRMAGPKVKNLGLYGFGVAAHLLIQVALYEGKKVYAFTRPGDTAGQESARRSGVTWVGGSDESPPEPLDAAILFAPVGALVPAALRAVVKGGSVVCGGIHMSDIPGFPYDILWGERVIRSVANLTRADGDEFLALAPKVPVRTQVQVFPLAQANEALKLFRSGQANGAVVLSLTT